ncbi:hypothetical protein ARMA_1182 [Ardenticatena maritima]|uniref:Uncharacterized protein n=1 Tax=Ardenticatena maritima TaxID=872965 RepID=A0A0M8K8P9_9CHLR|nr:hypothetical protein ARMA_1182 [Ardenticatena maritima]
MAESRRSPRIGGFFLCVMFTYLFDKQKRFVYNPHGNR